MPDDHIEQEIDDIDEDALLRSMGIITPRHRIVNVEGEAESKGHAHGSKIDRHKKATASKYENIAKRVKEIWQQHGFGPGEDQRDWPGVLSDIKSMITPLPDIESARSKVKRIGPAERSKPNQSRIETTPVLTHELIPEHEEEICQQHDCEPDEDEQNGIENEGSNINKNETTQELAHEFIADPAKEIWEQSECESGEDEQNRIESEDSNVNQSETTPELTYELIAERAKQIWQHNGCRPGEDQQNWAEAETQLKAELNID